MAYSDYGSFVHRNGERRRDKEDVGVFDTDEASLPSGVRIFANIMKRRVSGTDECWQHSQHGVLGDGLVRVACYKQGLPSVWHWPEGAEKPLKLELPELEGVDYFEFENVSAEFLGHKFRFTRGDHSEAYMTEPDGTEWKCEYDYGFGAGHTD